MKLLNQGVALAVVGTGLAALPMLHAQADPTVTTARADNGVEAMKNEATGPVLVSADAATDRVDFIRLKGKGDLMPSAPGEGRSAALEKSAAYLNQYAASFGARPAELVRSKVTDNGYGFTVDYVQKYQGVPVFGALVRAHVDQQGDLTSVNGYAAPRLDLSVTPRLSTSDAAEAALAQVRQNPPTTEQGAPADLTGIEAKNIELTIYRSGLTRGVDGTANLAYKVEVTNGANVRDIVILHANAPKVLNRWSMVHEALNRVLKTWNSALPGADKYETVWSEGETPPTNQDMRNLIDSTGESYWMFANTFGRDSFDDAGALMDVRHNRPVTPTSPCPNASWNGSFTSYCDGVYADDVVSHEWAHAYTEYTSGLIYQWQSGALNESYSDVWGETLDLINNREDAAEGDLSAIRPVGQCSTHSPATPVVTINSPASIAKTCDSSAASFGPQLTGTGVTGDVVLGLDADEDGDGDPNPFDLEGSVYDGCSPFTNEADLDGKIVLVNRGLCGFEVKARNVDAAGGIAAIIANRESAPAGLGGDADPDPDIPSVSINKEDRNLIAAAIEADGATVNLTMLDGSGDRVDSYRWLVGEKASAFGGAIRDMWNPTCHGDPGKVSDAEYYCGFEDAGGVHGNSGVPNHLYALAVDGGTYEGQTIAGLGLDKAANIWFRTQSQYLTPASDFPDMANSLLASCNDLTGQEILELDLTPNATPGMAAPITSADCAELGKAIVATGMNDNAIALCDYQPMLDPNAPSACGAGFTASTVWAEDFEDGLAGWGTEQELASIPLGGGQTYEGGFGAPWESSAAAGHAGKVAFGPAPALGSCTGDGGDDFSSRDSIISPVVKIPSAGSNPLLSFDHSIATEVGFDGGTVHFSRNGATFEVVPASAYVFNAPDKIASLAEQNSNPLAGLDGFTGTDEGQNKGSWGQSQVSLTALGAVPGDTFSFRFDIGRDGCGGVDGWYVDNVKVTTCSQTPTPTPTTSPTPTPTGKAETDTKVKVKPRKVHRGDAFKVIVKVTADVGKVTGKVKVLLDGKRVAKRRLDDGRVVVRVKRLLTLGKHKVVAKYLGSNTMRRSKDDARLRVIR